MTSRRHPLSAILAPAALALHLFVTGACGRGVWGEPGVQPRESADDGGAPTDGFGGPPATDGGGIVFVAPVGPMRGFLRNDGVEAIVYKGVTSGPHVVVEAEQTIGEKSQVYQVSSVPAANTPWGYLRSDNVNTIMYMSADGHVHEVTQRGTSGPWSDADFTAHFGLPAASSETIFAYVRTDGVDSILFRASDGDIIEVYSDPQTGWGWGDLTAVVGSPPSLDSPVAYIRSDNKCAVLYTAASDNHVHEIASNVGGFPAWVDTDLFLSSGLSLTTRNDAWGYKRSDNINAVVFTEGGTLYELSTPASGKCSTGHMWCEAILTTDATTSSGYRPSAYVRWDSNNAVVYRSATDTLNELSLGVGDTAWGEAILPIGPLTGGTVTPTGSSVPFGLRAPGMVDSILFEGKSTSSGTDPFELYRPVGESWQILQVEL
jgi:hypothetical protein